MSMLIIFIQKAIAQGIGIMFGALGEILTEKSGNLNLGIPGIMYMGGIAGLIGAFLYESNVENPIGWLGLVIAPALRAVMCCARRVNLQLPDDYTARKPECNRSCADHLRCRLRKLFRRISCKAGRRCRPDFCFRNRSGVPCEDSGTQQDSGNRRYSVFLWIPDVPGGDHCGDYGVFYQENPYGTESESGRRKSGNCGCSPEFLLPVISILQL